MPLAITPLRAPGKRHTFGATVRGLELSGGRDSLGFLFLYELMTSSLNLRILPKKGTALVFNDVLDSGVDDERTEHSGQPPTSGVKYAINCWIRAKGAKGSGGLGTFFS